MKIPIEMFEPDFRATTCRNALALSICEYLSEDAYQTIYKIVELLEEWAGRTYEGRRVSFSVMVANGPEPAEKVSVELVLREDFGALLSNSADGILKVSRGGNLLGFISADLTFEENERAPYRFRQLANATKEGSICITLTNSGEILVFKGREIVFSKRRGAWGYLNHDTLQSRLLAGSRRIERELINAVRESLLDASFGRSGACLAIVRRVDLKVVTKDLIDSKDIVESGDSLKSRAIRLLIGNRKFQELDRTLRKELLAIDGATVLDYKGNIVATGAIIPVTSQGKGGRHAAAIRLSAMGPTMKVSSDGTVQGFLKNKRNRQTKTLFTIG